jgi:DnaK suppressor protein
VKTVARAVSKKTTSKKPLAPRRPAHAHVAPGKSVAAKTKHPVAPPPPPPARRVVKPAPPAPPPEPKYQAPATPPTSVPTNGKPRKNLAGLTSRELEFFRALILDKRRQLVGDVSSLERDVLGGGSGSNLSNLPLHMADMGTDNYEQEFALGLMEKDRKLLKELNRALAKIQDGSYGICEGTGQPISKVRLEAQPWARFSIEYARKLERGLIHRVED